MREQLGSSRTITSPNAKNMKLWRRTIKRLPRKLRKSEIWRIMCTKVSCLPKKSNFWDSAKPSRIWKSNWMNAKQKPKICSNKIFRIWTDKQWKERSFSQPTRTLSKGVSNSKICWWWTTSSQNQTYKASDWIKFQHNPKSSTSTKFPFLCQWTNYQKSSRSSSIHSNFTIFKKMKGLI